MPVFDTVWHKWFKRPYTLHALQEGEGTQSVVLLHGVGVSGETWNAFLSQAHALGLGQQWCIMAPDLLGFGRSPKPQWAQYSVEEHARSVVATIKSAGLKGNSAFNQ